MEYVLVSPNVTDLNFLEQVGANQTTPTRLVAVVTRQGVVRSLRFTAEGTYRGETVHVTNRYRITGVGETHVERPAWLDDALNATRTTPTRTAGSGRVFGPRPLLRVWQTWTSTCSTGAASKPT